jgi:hypothetical protein
MTHLFVGLEAGIETGSSRKSEFGFPQGGVPSSFYDKHRYEPRPIFDGRDEHRQP